MPSRHSTPTKSSRRAEPRLTLVRSPKGRKPGLAAKKSARGSKAVAVNRSDTPTSRATALLESESEATVGEGSVAQARTPATSPVNATRR